MPINVFTSLYNSFVSAPQSLTHAIFASNSIFLYFLLSLSKAIQQVCNLYFQNTFSLLWTFLFCSFSSFPNHGFFFLTIITLVTSGAWLFNAFENFSSSIVTISSKFSALIASNDILSMSCANLFHLTSCR